MPHVVPLCWRYNPELDAIDIDFARTRDRAAHSRWYWRLKLYLITTPDGMPAVWCLADPKLGEREVAAELLAHAARWRMTLRRSA